MNTENINNILQLVNNEVVKQHQKWGQQNHPSLDPVLLNRSGVCTPERMCQEYEIPGELRSQFLCENAFKKNQGTWAHIAVEELCESISEFDPEKRKQELIQLAAVCISWIDSIDRNEL